MCGIFGIVAESGSSLSRSKAESILRKLYVLSESRGKESAGISIKTVGRMWVLKDKIPATDFIRSKPFKTMLDDALGQGEALPTDGFSIIAHSRLVTNGTHDNNENNQPCIKDDIVMVHNGIITNVDHLWETETGLTPRKYEVDTEVFASLIRSRINTSGKLTDAVAGTFDTIEGAASVALTFADLNSFVLATNTGSLYYWHDREAGLLVFASEDFIMRQIVEQEKLNEAFGKHPVVWLEPGHGLHLNTSEWAVTPFDFETREQVQTNACSAEISDLTKPARPEPIQALQPLELTRLEKLLEYNIDEIKQLRRCSKTVLPETFPFIEFDENGVCNYAHNYKPIYAERSIDDLKEILSRYRRNDGKPDVIVPFSGGRDSSYGLHLIKNELDMNPITFTYDWGMVTDLARRNIARMCGELGVENILVSADIKWKRENIRKNVAAWLKKPELGMIPLFMAGDKHFFKIVNDIKKQTGISLNLWMSNWLENTNFKTGFAGIRPQFEKESIYSLRLVDKIGMPLYYLKNFIKNPAYLNGSLGDTFSAFKVYYFEPREDYYLPFNYIHWDEDTINKTLIERYNWETAPDTNSTWRIGDGTASFYNYVYYTVCGFTEYETFRSNQIMEGMITRDYALETMYAENEPRFESIKWYLDTIGIDFEYAIKQVNAIPKLYR